jgi:hypothetical protein
MREVGKTMLTFCEQMKGRTLEELDELFEKRVGVFKFKAYRTEIQDKALHDVQANTGAFLDKGPAVSHVEEETGEKTE